MFKRDRLSSDSHLAKVGGLVVTDGQTTHGYQAENSTASFSLPPRPSLCTNESSVLSVALATGECQPGKCGVGDYASCLAKALKAAGAEVSLIRGEDWHLAGSLAISRSLKGFDIVHIQYPTAGFGTKLGPQALSLLERCVVTVHEASARHILRKLSLIPFAFRSNHLIFTSESERQFAMRWAPWISGKSSVIPIGSNIGRGPTNRPRRVNEIVYFGLILPGKGLEQVLQLSALIQSATLPFTVRILGQVPSGYRAYYESLRSRAAGLPVRWSLGLSDEQVAEELSQAYIAYLPYPDGASERRATLKAALLNGVAVITTCGAHTPSGWEEAVKFCRTPQEACDAIRAMADKHAEIARMTANGAQIGQSHSWEYIAQRHLEIFQSVVDGKSGSAR